jgi:hypothetical protein
MTRDEFLTTVVPALLSFLSVALPALLAWIGTIFKDWKDKQNEALNRQALHSAGITGMASAEQKYRNSSSISSSDKVAYTVDYMKKSVPEAIRELKASTEVLNKIAQSKETKPCPPDSPQPVSPPLS